MNIYKEIEAQIQAATHIVITAHKSADGDSIGSSLGLLSFYFLLFRLLVKKSLF